MATPDPLFIDQAAQLASFCESLQDETILAIDTEFIPEQTFVPVLALVQVATEDGRIAVIDYPAIGREGSEPLAALVRDPAVLKVFHAAWGDLEVLQPLAGQVPAPIWDTQLATGFFGYGGRTGYGAIVESLLGARVVDGETHTDWTRRPLSAQQLRYAAEDVRYLIPLYRYERRILAELGRVSWAEEEFEGVITEMTRLFVCRADESKLYLDVRGSQGLDRKGLAVLRELAIWREREARRRNRPRRSVMRDELLVQMTRRAPVNVRQLGELRGIHPRELQGSGEELIRAIQRGKQTPPGECPEARQPAPALNEDESALAALLSAALQALAHDNRIGSTLIANSSELQRLVYAYLRNQAAELQILNGWRGELVGRQLMEILDGRCQVGWDPADRSLTLRRYDGAGPAA